MNKISVLLPTRKRTELVHSSINSVLANASHPEMVEILIAYDEDDAESKNYFESEKWTNLISQYGATSKIFETERHGYIKLYKYVNLLSEKATGNWLIFWNDDSVMDTQSWDDTIRENDGYFGLLRAQSNHNHPFAIFPIVPKQWVEEFGMFSPVNHSDWWTYQCCAPIGRMRNIPIHVTHNRANVNGMNNDATFQEQDYGADGQDPSNPEDYSHPDRKNDLIAWQHRILAIANEDGPEETIFL